MDDFPGNRQQSRQPREELPPAGKNEQKRVQRVVEGEVIRRKKPMSRRFKEVLLGGDSRSVGEYVFLDILIPGIRDIISDVATTSIERMVYGGDAPRHHGRRPSQRGGGLSHVDYRGFSRNDRRDDRRPSRDDKRDHRRQTMNDLDEVILMTRVEAEETLSQMYDILEKFESVTVADLWEILGQSSQYTDNRYGWTDLIGSNVSRVRGGYLLDLPRPELLKD